MDAEQIALFPLHSVLLPGGLLPLRIFEPRYVDLVGRCMRQGEVFGVVLLQAGNDTDSEVSTVEVGTSARIVDFQPMQGGLLGVLCRGEQRFRIRTRTRQADGLNRAVVSWLPEPPAEPLAPMFEPWVQLLRQAISTLTNSQRFFEPHYEDAGWVSNRLAELLAPEPALLQWLLELDEPNERLRLLAPLIESAMSAAP